MADVDVLLKAGFSPDEVQSYLGSAGFSPDEIASAMGGPTAVTVTRSPTLGESASFVGKSLAEGAGELLDLLGGVSVGPAAAIRQATKQPKASGAADLVHEYIGTPEDTGVTGPVARLAKGAVKASLFPMGGVAQKAATFTLLPRVMEKAVTKAAPRAASILNAIGGAGAEAGVMAQESLAPDSNIAKFLFPMAGAVAPNLLWRGAVKPVVDIFRPKAVGEETARQIAEDLRTVTPEAFTEARTVGERTKQIAEGLEATGAAAREAAGKAFEALPENAVVLDDAINNITKFADDVGSVASPGTRTKALIDKLNELKPQDKVVSTPASLIVNEQGRPITEAATSVTPGGPAKLPLNKVQNVLRDIGKIYRGASGVDKAIAGKAFDEVMGAAEKAVPREAMAALDEARSGWAQMRAAYEEGAVGSVRASVDDASGKLLTLKNKLLNDPKSAEQLAAVMTPSELKQAQLIMLDDLVQKTPVTWERAISKAGKYDSYRAIFGKEGADRLLKLVGRSGTIGEKLLKDNKGLGSLLSKIGLKATIGGAIGKTVAGEAGEVAGSVAGLASSQGGGPIAIAKSIILQAAAGNADALRILSQPAQAKGAYNAAITAIKNAIAGNVGNVGGDNSAKSAPNIFSPQKKTPVIEEAMPTSKEDVALIEEQIDADPYYSALYEAESGRDPNAQPPIDPKTGKRPSTAKGGFQFINSTAKALGVSDPFDLAESFKAVQTLTEDHRKRFGDNPKALYRAHVLGASLANKVAKGDSLSKDEKDLVEYFNTRAWPNFERRYNRIVKTQSRGSGLEEV